MIANLMRVMAPMDRLIRPGSLILLITSLVCGCGRSLEDEMRAKAAAMAAAPDAEEETEPIEVATGEAEAAPAVDPVPVPAASVPAPSPPAATPSAAVQAVAPKTQTATPALQDTEPSTPQPSVPQSAQQPLPPEEARARSVQNLERIAAALLAYVEEHKSLPNAATVITRGEQDVPLLSWRVRLLPYLGYEGLYRQFRFNEAWNSAHNKKLLTQIPAEYQSPDRFDTSTNYLIPVGNMTAFSGGQGRTPAHFTGGAENVVMLVEADDSHAAPWTAPQDLHYEAAAPRAGLGSRRAEGTLVALASGTVGCIGGEVSDAQLRELFSIDEDSVPAGNFVKAATSLSQPVAAVENSDASSNNVQKTTETAMGSNQSSAPPIVRLPEMSPSQPPRTPLPDETRLVTARSLLRDVYRQDYEAARTLDARRALVVRMLADAPITAAKPAEHYELLRVTRDMAVACGMIEESLEAARLTEQHFEIDGLALRAKTLEDLRKLTREPVEANRLVQQAMQVLREAIQKDHFTAAISAQEVYVAGLRLTGDRVAASKADDLKAMIVAIQDAHAEVPQALRTLQSNPNDSKASGVVGKYYCLVKQRWDEFLPLIARGDDVKLRIVAVIDLETSDDPEAMLQLADQYWQMAEEDRVPFAIGLKLRAMHYYARAADQTTGGLAKIRAQKRIQQWREQPEWISLLVPANPKPDSSPAEDE